MKTTRRALLQMIGLGAAAAALAPAVSVAAEEEHDAEFEQRAAIWAAGRCSYPPDCPCGDDMPAWTHDPEAVKRVLYGGSPDAIGHARADGSPSFFGATPVPVHEYTAHVHQHGSPECLGCIYDAQLPPAEHQAALERFEARASIGGAVSGEMGSESVVPFDAEKYGSLPIGNTVYTRYVGFQMPAKG